MAFLIHSVSTASTGREIRRTRRVDEARITIGRDPASDIVLADLEVSLNHAAIVSLGGSRLLVQATAGTPFTVDGKSAEQLEINARRGAEVLMGGFALHIAWDAEADASAITVERFALVARSSEHRDEHKLFSLGQVGPSRRVLAWSGFLVVLLAFLAWPIFSYATADTRKLTREQMAATSFHGDQSWTAGPLSKAHASLSRNCTACHAQAFVAVQDTTCKTCHATVHDHADPARLQAAMTPIGWQPKLRRAVATAFNRPAGRCVDCHTEHKGEQATAVPSQRFCADCHGELHAKLPDVKFGDASDFGKNHPQFRPLIQLTPGAHPELRRIDLDEHPRQSTGLLFSHAQHLSQTNGVARMAQTLGQAKGGGLGCGGCHRPDGTATGFRPIEMERDCQSCHSLAFGRVGGQVRTLRHGDAHQAIAELRDYYAANPGSAMPHPLGDVRRRPGEIVASAAPLAGDRTTPAIRALFQPNGLCADCHMIVSPSRPGATDYGIAPVSLPQKFLTRGFFDHRAHTTEACATCHKASASTDTRDPLMPGIATCRQCHVGEQGRGGFKLATNQDVKSTCAMCHVFHGDPKSAATAAQRDPYERKIAAAHLVEGDHRD